MGGYWVLWPKPILLRHGSKLLRHRDDLNRSHSLTWPQMTEITSITGLDSKSPDSTMERPSTKGSCCNLLAWSYLLLLLLVSLNLLLIFEFVDEIMTIPSRTKEGYVFLNLIYFLDSF